jgi:hypothetical protein
MFRHMHALNSKVYLGMLENYDFSQLQRRADILQQDDTTLRFGYVVWQ